VRPKIQIAFLLLVLVPIGLLAVLGFRVARDEREIVAREIETLERARLQDLEAAVASMMQSIERRFLAKLESVEGAAPDADALRSLARKEPLFRQPFSVSKTGALVHPRGRHDASQEELDFLARTRAIWSGEAVLYTPPNSEASTSSAARPKRTDDVVALASSHPHGWIVWYWEEGPHLMFWRRRPDGSVIGAEIERVALLSRIVGGLSQLASAGGDGSVWLRDEKNDALAKWSSTDSEPGGGADRARPIASVSLAHPLDFLRLEYVPSESERGALAGRTFHLGMMLGVLAVLLALSLLAIYFYRESTRELRDAAERVSFVTQVSHELKTPLTNVRLYAELLEETLDDSDREAKRRLGVIISESQRLGRLINNILTFSKHRQNKLQIHEAPVVIDEVVEGVLEQFGPLLEAKGIEKRMKLAAPTPMLGDKDALGQILANLFSNVEKYAAGGRILEVESREDKACATVTVRDRGPGIPAVHRGRIFEPFYRVSDRLADGVTGTGIGLTIARELARLHGGDLALVGSNQGAAFELMLPKKGGGAAL
jgi:signal transduction histidine kinase